MRNLSLLSESRTALSNSGSLLPLQLLGGPHRRHHVEQLIVPCGPVGCHGNLVFSKLSPGSVSFVVICCNGNLVFFLTVAHQRTSGSSSTIPAFSRRVTIYCAILRRTPCRPIWDQGHYSDTRYKSMLICTLHCSFVLFIIAL
jgi:hypothetical protein